jgi:hypothetical protein
MRLGNFEVPCGCDARKEIMFTYGNLGVIPAALLVGLLLAFIYLMGVSL